MEAYAYSTIAMCTRLKKKVFLAKGIAEQFLEIITVRILKKGAKITSAEFLPYGVVLEIRHPESLDTKTLVREIRFATSKPLRDTYMELWHMPSLWIRDYYLKNSCRTEDVNNEIQAYYNKQKSR